MGTAPRTRLLLMGAIVTSTALVTALVLAGAGRRDAVLSAAAQSPEHHASSHLPIGASPRPEGVLSPRPRAVVPHPPDLAVALERVWQTLQDTASVGVLDERTGRAYWIRPDATYDEASIVKLNIAEAVLWEAQRQGRWLTAGEQQLLTAMIQHSDNDAASALWRALDFGEGLAAYNRTLGLRRTTLDPGGAWGLTRTTVSDQLVLLRAMRSRTSQLSSRSRLYLQHQLADVQEDQRWGVSAGTPRGAHIELKNGWLPLSDHGWRVNSVGHVISPVVDFDIAVLTTDNGTEAEGIAAVEAVSRVVYGALLQQSSADRQAGQSTSRGIAS